MTDLVSGEAVVLELRLAKLPSRALAMSVDVGVQMVILFGVVLLITLSSPVLDPALAAAVTLVAVVLVLVGYPVVFETLSRGRSLGKLVLGLRVVRDDGGPVHFRHALVRGLAGFFVDFWVLGAIGGVGLIASLASAKGKRVGDMLAGTVVIRERMPVHGGAVPQMPPPLVSWASGLELSGLPDDLALAARQFLSRYHQFAPEVRDGIAQRLAVDVSRYVVREPPAGTPAPAYLAAVVAERRGREMSRLMARQPPQAQSLPTQFRPAYHDQGSPPTDGGFAPPG